MAVDRLPVKTICPFCKNEGDVAFPDKGRVADGQAALCLACGQIGITDFNAAGLVRLPNEIEQRKIDTNVRVQAYKTAWLEREREEGR